jgi:methyl-accepting chemotaxis protein
VNATLPSSRSFQRRVIALSYLYSFAAVVLVLPSLGVLLELRDEQWSWLLGAAAAYAVVITPLQTAVHRRIFGALPQWLDACARGERSPELARAAFAAALDLPRRSALLGVLGWALPVALLSLAMELRWPTWGAFETASLSLVGLEAGVLAAIFLWFRVKREAEDVRAALAAELADPTLRASLVRFAPLRTVLALSVTALCVAPVAFSGLLLHALEARSLEQRAAGWLRDALGAGGPFAPLASQLEIVEIDGQTPAPGESPLEESVLAELRLALAQGERSGDSLGIPSRRIFAWQLEPDGRLRVASLPASALALERGRTWGVLLALLAGAACVALGMTRLVAGDLSRATLWLRQEAERLASGDLRDGRVYESEDELGELARSFEAMRRSLRDTVARLAAAADRVDATAASAAAVASSVGAVSADQVEGIRRSTASLEAVDRQVRDIAGSASALGGSVEESSSSILELGAASEELDATAGVLSERVNEVSASVEQMVRSVQQVAANTEALATAAVETSASMAEMATSMREVDASAEESARLSRQVVDCAESGQARVVQTIAGMEAIREATDTAERVIRSLGSRASEIGAIVDVIDDVADETGLLALNAAIIAAQAGEHGRAFSVVADEIKDLADRVLASTKEIGGLIRAVQEESANAIGAVEKGARSVASGVDLAAEAGVSLEEITQASRESGQRIAAIVQAVREQARAASQVVELMERVREGVEEIGAAAAEQERGNQVVHRNVLAMREVAQQVRATTEEQARGSGRIRESVEGVRSAVEQIGEALVEQGTGCRSAVEALAEVQRRTRSNEESVQRLDEVVKGLVAEAESLRRDVRRFRLA